MTSVRERFLSLDVFRGVTVFLMIMVNTPGPGADPPGWMMHAPWVGFTLADLVFPSFLFAVGNALCFSMRPGSSDREFLLSVLRRSAIIFALGVLLYWYPFFKQQADGSWAAIPFAQTRLTGVLQRIAVCYALAAIAARFLSVRQLIALAIALLLGYWWALKAFGVPGAELTKMGNAGTRLDLWLIGPEHLYRKAQGFDPEGLLSTLPATVNVIGGYLVGLYVRERGKSAAGALRLAAAGCALLALALLWDPLLPIMKKLWTGSFVFYTLGWDLLLLAALLYTIEIRRWTHGAGFFAVLGRNPLVLYLFSEVLVITLRLIKVAPDVDVYAWISVAWFQWLLPGATGVWVCAVAYTLVCWALAYWMDRRGVYVRI